MKFILITLENYIELQLDQSEEESLIAMPFANCHFNSIETLVS